MLREELLGHARQQDFMLVRLSLESKPFTREDGRIQVEDLKAITAGVMDEWTALIQPHWSTANGECRQELFLCRGPAPIRLYDTFAEMAAGVMRCLLRSERFAADYRIPQGAGEAGGEAFDGLWSDVLTKLAGENSHPVVRFREGRLKFTGATRRAVVYFGDYWVDANDVPADVLPRLREAAKGRNYVRTLECGVMRGSAYALDLLAKRYGVSD